MDKRIELEMLIQTSSPQYLAQKFLELETMVNKLQAQLQAMVDGLELQNDAINGSPEALKVTCQIVALAAKKYDPMKAQLERARELIDEWETIARDERARIINEALCYEDKVEANTIADERDDCANELKQALEKDDG